MAEVSSWWVCIDHIGNLFIAINETKAGPPAAGVRIGVKLSVDSFFIDHILWFSFREVSPLFNAFEKMIIAQ